MTDAERRSFENLILLCPNCHRLIDSLDSGGHSVERLTEIKERHELHCAGTLWANESELDHYAALALSVATHAAPQPSSRARPRLVAEKGERKAITIANVGDADAHNVAVTPIDPRSQDGIVIAGISPGRMSAGTRWIAGHYAPTFGSDGPYVLRVAWADDAGTRYDDEFPF